MCSIFSFENSPFYSFQETASFCLYCWAQLCTVQGRGCCGIDTPTMVLAILYSFGRSSSTATVFLVLKMLHIEIWFTHGFVIIHFEKLSKMNNACKICLWKTLRSEIFFTLLICQFFRWHLYFVWKIWTCVGVTCAAKKSSFLAAAVKYSTDYIYCIKYM